MIDFNLAPRDRGLIVAATALGMSTRGISPEGSEARKVKERAGVESHGSGGDDGRA